MKTSRSNTKQQTLPGMEQALCACGCGNYFMRVTRGRKRMYLNDSHKKRVMRARRKARQTDTRVMLTPKGIARACELAGRNIAALWEQLTPDEQWVLHLAEQHPSGAEAFWYAVETLQRQADSELKRGSAHEKTL